MLGIERLQEAFFARFPDYDRGITVPAIVDVPTGQVVTNDFAQITLDLSAEWRAHHRPGAPDLYPEPLREEIDEVNRRVFADVNNGVYRAGFAGSQEAYEEAYDRLFDRAGLAVRAAGRRSGTWSATPSPRPTCGCSPRWSASTRSTTATSSATGSKLTEMPVLWAYARDLFQTPGLRRHDRLRPHQAALLRGAPRHQPDRHRAGRPGPGRLAGRRTAGRRWAAARSATARRRHPRRRARRSHPATPH